MPIPISAFRNPPSKVEQARLIASFLAEHATQAYTLMEIIQAVTHKNTYTLQLEVMFHPEVEHWWQECVDLCTTHDVAKAMHNSKIYYFYRKP